MSNKLGRGQNGFTIVETLIAVSILALVFATVYSVFNVGAAAGSRRTADIHLSARASLKLIGKEIRSSCFRPGADAYAFSGEDSRSDGADADTISFCSIETKTRADGAAFPAPAKITYMVSRHPGTGEAMLYRSVETIGGKDAGDVAIEPVAPFVKELDIQYESGGAWMDRWESRDAAPDRIRIRIGLSENDEPGARRWFEIVADVKSRSVPRENS